MREPTEIISNVSALLVICAVSALVLALPASPEPTVAGPQGAVELSLEATAPEPPKEVPQPEPTKAEPPAAAVEPTPPEPVTPPPTPEAPQEPQKPEEEPPKPVEMLMDEDGEKSKLKQPALEAVSDEVKSKFQACLRKFMVGLTAKESKKAGERGPVRVTLSYEDNKLLALDIVLSSGSPLVDQRARTNALNSDCGKVVKTGSVSIEMNY